jgi:hypothetical protein
MVFEELVFSPLNHLTWLTARENFIVGYESPNEIPVNGGRDLF